MSFIRTKVCKDYIKFVKSYQPFDWEDVNTHSVIVSYIRFFYVYKLLKSIFSNKDKVTVMDIGAYPGGMLKLLMNFFGNKVKYIGVGLGFNEEYRSTMKALDVELAEAEIDPNFCQIHSVEDLGTKNLSKFNDIECVLFLDIIEHLTDPVFSLDLINSKMITGGDLIITTDNITSLGYLAHMIYNGRSPNIHPIRSSLIFQGLWRPHHREYSKDELKFYLDYCGFELVSHQYFDREQGDYSLNMEGKITYNPKFYLISRVIRGLIKMILPHLKEHHIFHFKKKVDFSIQSIERPKKTLDVDEWMKIRRRYGQL